MTRALSSILSLSILIIIFTTIINFTKVQFSDSEANSYLPIETYIDGKNQVTHPSIIDFDSTWNGYRYWLAYTPYPFGNGGEENPSLSASNDLKNWHTPNGLYNPIANNEEVNCDELKDSHLVYRADINQLEMWYMGRINSTIKSGGDLLLLRKHSTDGINWSNYEIMKIMNGTLSPSIIYEDGKYKLWSIAPSKDGDETNGQLLYAESINGFDWSDYQSCLFNDSEDLSIWHGSVSKSNEGYHFVWIEDSGDSDLIKYAFSKDGTNFTSPQIVVKKAADWKAFYRPHILKNETGYNLFYGVITHENEWYIALSQGNNINSLKGYNLGISQHTNYYIRIIKNVIKSLNQYFRVELLALIILCLAIIKLFNIDRLGLLWGICWTITFIYNYLKFSILIPIDIVYILCCSGLFSLLISAASLNLKPNK